MKSKKTLNLWMIALAIIVTSSFLFLTALGIVGTINLFVISSVIISLLYMVRVKRNQKWMVLIIPVIFLILGIALYVITLLINNPGNGFGVGLMFSLAIVLFILSILSLTIYQILERSYYPNGTYQRTDQTYLSNEWILFVFVINMFIFQVIEFIRGNDIMRILLEFLIIGLVSALLYFILFFLNKRQKNMNLFSLVGLLFIGTYVGYAYISKTEIPFYASSGSHLLLIYFLIKDHFNKKADKREQH
jgi:hypothetical protein